MSMGRRGAAPAGGTAKAPPISVSSEPTGQTLIHLRTPARIRTHWSNPHSPPDPRQEREKHRPLAPLRGPGPHRHHLVSGRGRSVPAGSRSEDDPCLGLRRPADRRCLRLLHYPASVRHSQYPYGRIWRIFLSFRDFKHQPQPALASGEPSSRRGSGWAGVWIVMRCCVSYRAGTFAAPLAGWVLLCRLCIGAPFRGCRRRFGVWGWGLGRWLGRRMMPFGLGLRVGRGSS